MSIAGEPRELARYELPDQRQRILIGQRVQGRVAVSDVPADEHGRVYLVERHVESRAALEGLIAAYVADAAERGELAIQVPRDIGASDVRG